VVLPDWLPLTADECLAFLDRVASVAAPVPVVLYNPPHAKTQVSPELLGVERRIGVLFERHIAPQQARGLSNPALDKFLAAIGDWADVGLRVRWPYASAPAGALVCARQDARELLPELFSSLR